MQVFNLSNGKEDEKKIDEERKLDRYIDRYIHPR